MAAPNLSVKAALEESRGTQLRLLRSLLFLHRPIFLMAVLKNLLFLTFLCKTMSQLLFPLAALTAPRLALFLFLQGPVPYGRRCPPITMILLR